MDQSFETLHPRRPDGRFDTKAAASPSGITLDPTDGEGEKKSPRYVTIEDAKEQIRTALEGSVGKYDIDGIADEMFDYDDGYDEETGARWLNSAGYYDTTSGPEEFWQIAFNHQLPDD